VRRQRLCLSLVVRRAARMEPIDQPFRPRADFFVVWVILAVPTFLLTRGMKTDQGWFSYGAILILLSLFATIILYGPVLLARQIIRSGSRGWFVARVFVSTLLAAVLFAAILYFTGHGEHAASYSFAVSFIASAYFHWKLRNEPHA
jgi:hypothetical protein